MRFEKNVYSLINHRKQKNMVVDPSVFTCISMLARAVGPAMIKDVRDLLDSMFATGLR